MRLKKFPGSMLPCWRTFSCLAGHYDQWITKFTGHSGIYAGHCHSLASFFPLIFRVTRDFRNNCVFLIVFLYKVEVWRYQSCSSNYSGIYT